MEEQGTQGTQGAKKNMKVPGESGIQGKPFEDEELWASGAEDKEEDENRDEENAGHEETDEREDDDAQDRYITNMVLNVVDFHDDTGGANDNLVVDLIFKGKPNDFKKLARAVLLRSLPEGLAPMVEEFVTGLPDFETWCQAQDSLGIQEEARETENCQRQQI